jgi:hypothetical protein
MGEFFAASTLLGSLTSKSPREGPPDLFLLAWLCGWTLGGAAAAYTWIWNVAGREIVTSTETTLSIARAPVPFPGRKDFDWSSVRNLRVSPVVPSSENRSLVAGSKSGTVAFDYGARTFRFGDQLDEAESAILVEAILRRFPQART